MVAGAGQSEDLVPMQVPRSLLGEVSRLIADYYAAPTQTAPGSNTGTPAPEDADEVREGEWSVEDFRALIADGREGPQRAGRVLDVLAKHPDSRVSYSKLATGAGLTEMQLRGGLSGLTWFCNQRWPDHGTRGIWPMRKTWARTERDDKIGESQYTLPAVHARRWLRARHGDPSC